MNSAIERLLTLRVSDVMSRNVVSVEAAETMRRAAGTLTQHFISGAPVVDKQGQCIGMLSATDFMQCVAELPEDVSAGETDNRNGNRDVPHACPMPATDSVASHMSALVQPVEASQPLTQAARLMCQNHIHRLVVLDREGQPTGMLTSLDIVAAVINAVEE
jgi:predicted transcriptional regulator